MQASQIMNLDVLIKNSMNSQIITFNQKWDLNMRNLRPAVVAEWSKTLYLPMLLGLGNIWVTVGILWGTACFFPGGVWLVVSVEG